MPLPEGMKGSFAWGYHSTGRVAPISSRLRGTTQRGEGLTRQSFEEIDTLIRSLRTGSREWVHAMDLATQALAVASHGIVTKYYMGGRVTPQTARVVRSTWGTPIRRVTGRTFAGWKVKRRGMGVWELYNEERGAYMVEFGIVRGGHGVARRPLKRSSIATLRFIQRTRFGQRIMEETFGNLRNNKGHFRSFSSRMQGSSILGIAGPTGHLPG